MAGEFSHLLQDVFLGKSKSDSANIRMSIAIRNDLIKMFQHFLKEPGDILEFKVEPSKLNYVVDNLDSVDITNEYEVWQVSRDTFRARQAVIAI